MQRQLKCVGALLFASSVLGSCQAQRFISKVVPEPVKTPEPLPEKPQVVPQKVEPTPQPPPPPPPEPVHMQLLRFEQDAWYRTCFWLTINGQHSDETALGCNKGIPQLGHKKKLVVGTTSSGQEAQCVTLGLRAEVYKNTENCTGPGKCAPDSYAQVASFVRSTSDSAESTGEASAFVIQERGSQEGIDSRIDATLEITAAARAWSQKPVSPELVDFRVYFEDQDAESMKKAFAPGGSWAAQGVDFNDIVFELSIPKSLRFSFEATKVSCAPAKSSQEESSSAP